MPFRRSYAAAAPLLILLAVPVPAHAVVAPAMSVTASHTSSTITMCADGALRAGTATAPTWVMETTTVRASGIPQSDSSSSSNATTFHACVTKSLTDPTTMQTVFTYAGMGDDYPSVLAGYAIWQNGRYDELETSH